MIKKLVIRTKDGERLDVEFAGGAPVSARLRKSGLQAVLGQGRMELIPSVMMQVLVEAAWVAPGTTIETVMERRAPAAVEAEAA